jgi:hypothetical protein
LVPAEETASHSDEGKTYHSLKPMELHFGQSDLSLEGKENEGRSNEELKVEDFVFIDTSHSMDWTTPGGVSFQLKPLDVVPNMNQEEEEERSRKVRRRRAGQDMTTDLCKAKMTKLRDDSLELYCEWDECPEKEAFASMKEFMAHVAEHVDEVEVKYAEEKDEEEQGDSFACLWQDCGYETAGSADMVRHVHFHAYHTKIKFHGERVVRETGAPPCRLDNAQRNLVPDLSEPFRCYWSGCVEEDKEFPQAQRFYWHVEWHAEEFRGRGREGVPCRWGECKAVVMTVNKLKEHLRSHSQERTVACKNLFLNLLIKL